MSRASPTAQEPGWPTVPRWSRDSPAQAACHHLRRVHRSVIACGAFVFGDFVLIKILGFALGVAVFLDATVIRTAVGPALIRLAGRWNWWPGLTTKSGWRTNVRG